MATQPALSGIPMDVHSLAPRGGLVRNASLTPAWLPGSQVGSGSFVVSVITVGVANFHDETVQPSLLAWAKGDSVVQGADSPANCSLSGEKTPGDGSLRKRYPLRAGRASQVDAVHGWILT